MLIEQFATITIPDGVDIQMPPNCFTEMQGTVLEYVPKTSLTVSFPVFEKYTNPGKTMQGGHILAAFDNVFGPLSFLTAQVPTTTINLQASFQRPIFPGDTITITATIKSCGRRLLHMYAEAYNGNNKLVATSSTDYMVV